MNIIGISAFFHDAACCLLQDGQLKAAAEEERFSRIKADPSLPVKAFRYCLQEGGLSVADVDCIAYYEDPQKKLARQLWSGMLGNTPDLLKRLEPGMVGKRIREMLGYEGPIHYADHHQAHAASSYFFSGFKEAAILTVDGVGEWATTTYGIGKGTRLSILEEVQFPDSIGLLYSTITSYLGFEVNEGEYKVMGLAPYGQPIYTDKIWQLIQSGENGQYSLNMAYFGFLQENRMYTCELEALMGKPARMRGDSVEQFHQDVARSLQVVLEELLLAKVNYLHQQTGSENLCMSGGVALNCVANGKIRAKGPFKDLFVQPAANDAGGAIGAAALAHFSLRADSPPMSPLQHVYLGPSFSGNEVARLLDSTSLQYQDFRGNREGLLAATAEKISEGKVIGWFQGRMEFGPRSLGARSIIADPRNEQMRDRINQMVKKREGFRPFAPAVLDKKMKEHFNIDHYSPFMLETCQVKSALPLPAITHVDGSARLQTVHRERNERFYQLLEAFDRLTGCPILLNTSFNVKGEPIVCSPEDAIKCFILTDIDTLVIEDFIVDRASNDLETLRFFFSYEASRSAGISQEVYTFI
ncbi:MAG: carbamoyltransferase [Chitinophaga sp.]|uniref:carbamoyltransferase family protein n=1 Tax=Chitinophaga sp. TaxID=1869181 RepID=UPI001B1DB8D0|nr:carbamoyltransferase N-terminal domain-containing protein [Chitinophaga sp.]MBO9729954.1 carbamoyltransferase [Chitinophaga sp.]